MGIVIGVATTVLEPETDECNVKKLILWSRRRCPNLPPRAFVDRDQLSDGGGGWVMPSSCLRISMFWAVRGR